MTTSDWRETRLAQHVRLWKGLSYKSTFFDEGGYALVNLKCILPGGGFRLDGVKWYTGPHKEEHILRPGDTVAALTDLTQSGDVMGRPARVPDFTSRKMVSSLDLVRAEVLSSELDPDFLFYRLRAYDYVSHVRGRATGTTVRHLSPKDILEFEFRIPPLSEQRVIARVLGKLDEKIDLNRRMNETLEEIARTLFKSWFVDFDPVCAKMEGRQLAGIDYEINALFPDSFEDSALGEIPKGWSVEPLDQVAHFLNGLALQKYPPEGDEYLPAIKIAELRKGVTQSSGRASTKLPPQYVVEDGDVLFSWSGSLEVQLWTGGQGALNQHLFKVTSERYPKWFYYYWIRQHLTEFRGIAADKATTMGHIKRHHLSDALTVVPPASVLHVMSAVMEPVVSKMLNNSLEVRTLAAIRDALLPKLMSGEIRVSDAETQIEEAV